MKSGKNLKYVSKQVTVTLVILFITVLFAPAVWAAGKQAHANTTVTGSGQRYKTTVTRQTKGQISSEDLRQVSLLTSQVLMHVGKAEQSIELGNSNSAKAEIKDAEALIAIAHNLLPVNLVTTIVKDARGKEVYKNIEATQDDVIPMYRDVAAVDVFDDIINAKKAQVEGKEFLGRVNLNATMLADLGYIGRKLQHAMQLINNSKTDEAGQQLFLARTYGVDVRFSDTESPLIDAQRAFSLAEQMVNEKNYDAATDNLNLAKLYLLKYSQLSQNSEANRLKGQELRKDIDSLVGSIKEKGAAGKIRTLWYRTTALFKRYSSRAKTATRKMIKSAAK